MADLRTRLAEAGQKTKKHVVLAGRKTGFVLKRSANAMRRFGKRCLRLIDMKLATLKENRRAKPSRSDSTKEPAKPRRRPDSQSRTMVRAENQSQDLVKRPPKKEKTPPIRRQTRQRVYRLKGYTTVAKVQRRHQAELQQQLLRKVLLFLGLLLTLIILFQIYNPFRGDRTEWYRIIGISEFAELTEDNPLFPELSEENAEDAEDTEDDE